MRYIKVKRDEEILIYDITDYSDGFRYYIIDNCLYYGKHEATWLGEIIEESDNLEELCDEFVVGNPKADIKKPFIINMPFNKWLQEVKENTPNGCFEYKIKKDGMNIYGAIWTSKGLIYVAKLNDKGEMELL